MRQFIVRLGLLLACCLTASCVALGGIDRETGTIDKEVGGARNTSILLNIVRASQGEPLYFYSINQVGGSGLEDFKLSLPPVTLGPRQTAAQRNFTFGTNGLNVLDSQVSGNFNVAVLDSKNFYAGMLAPLDLLEINILLRQGFPRELVYRLVVQDVTVYWAPDPRKPQGELDRFVNDPGAPPPVPGAPPQPSFDLFLNAAMSHGITIEQYQVVSEKAGSGGQSGKSGGQDSGASGAQNASAGNQAANTTTLARLCSDLALVAPPGASPPGADPAPGPYNDVQLSGNACGARPTVLPADLNSDQGISDLQHTFMACAASQTGGEGHDHPQQASPQGVNRVCARLNGQVVAVQLDTRSLYGIFRYLGQALAHQNDVELNDWGSPAEPRAQGPLIAIVRDKNKDCFASVDLHGRYCIPGEDSENLKQTFSIINALQALKTSAGDLPYTPTVRIEQ